jgi:hypothetical protein
MTMTRNLMTASIAAALMITAALAQAQGQEQPAAGSTIASPAAGNTFVDPQWVENHPFPRSFGSATD